MCWQTILPIHLWLNSPTFNLISYFKEIRPYYGCCCYPNWLADKQVACVSNAAKVSCFLGFIVCVVVILRALHCKWKWNWELKVVWVGRESKELRAKWKWKWKYDSLSRFALENMPPKGLSDDASATQNGERVRPLKDFAAWSAQAQKRERERVRM